MTIAKCTLCGNEVIPTVIGRNKEERTAAFGHAAVKHIEKVHPELFKPLPVLNATFNGFYVASHFEIPEGSELWDEIENTRTLLIDVVMKGAPEEEEEEDDGEEDEEGEDEEEKEGIEPISSHLSHLSHPVDSKGVESLGSLPFQGGDKVAELPILDADFEELPKKK